MACKITFCLFVLLIIFENAVSSQNVLCSFPGRKYEIYPDQCLTKSKNI